MQQQLLIQLFKNNLKDIVLDFKYHMCIKVEVGILLQVKSMKWFIMLITDFLHIWPSVSVSEPITKSNWQGETFIPYLRVYHVENYVIHHHVVLHGGSCSNNTRWFIDITFCLFHK